MRRVNEPAEAALRVNTLVAEVEDVSARLPVDAYTVDDLGEALVLEGPFDAHGSQLFAAGVIMPQSRGSMRVARTLAPRPGERVLDLCAAPGAKTTHMAALMEGRGEVVAVERHRGRAGALARTCERMRAGCARVEIGDARRADFGEGFDHALIDAPCSGLGTLQSRPDLRWRITPEDIAELACLQGQILSAGASAVAGGGSLVYSVCTISLAEGRAVIAEFVDRCPEWTLEESLQLLPHRDLTDGFFIARLRRDG
jgi:16S rRNA (cytosine967-C5)-methyltransferase